MKCIDNASYNEKVFLAKIHGAKIKRRSRVEQKNPNFDAKKSEQMDNMAEKMLERMKQESGKQRTSN